MMLSLRGGGYEYVDLGLPSGLKWAKCNVGAEKETDYGYYFQWGDIVDKSNADCSWATYKHCNGSETTLRKYNTSSSYGENPDNTTTLETEDDAATQIMGGNWRMPTKDECQELIDNTTNEWITNYNGSGVNGRKFTSKINGNTIFIPAAGVKEGISVDVVGYGGSVWSSSLNAASPNCAWYWEVEYDDYDMYNGEWRCFGYTVRGVFK